MENIWNLLPEEFKFLKNKDSYIVGGAVRNALIGKEIKDIDIITSKENIERILKIERFPVVKTNKRFETFRIVTNPTIDITLMEETLEKDLKRRDFTINSLAIDYKGQIIDINNGIRDIKKKQIKAVLLKNLKEDPLRMLRAFRFYLQYNFTIEKRTLNFLIRNFNLIHSVARERVKEELDIIFALKGCGTLLSELRGMGILYELIPILKTNEYFPAGKAHGRDLLDHNIITTIGVDMIEGLSSEEYRILRWATLLHDIAKPNTMEEKDNGSKSFYGHDNLGAKIAYNFLMDMRFSSEFASRVATIIKMHMRPHLINNNFTDKALRRIIKDSRGDYKLVIYNAICDAWADKADPAMVSNLHEMLKRLNELANEKPIKRPINGNDIMEIFNIPQSPLVGEIIDFIDEILMENPNETKEDIIKKIKQKFFEKIKGS